MITIRKASITDVPTVVSYIEKKAAFDHSLGCFDGILGMTPARIEKALFEIPTLAHSLLAFIDETPVCFIFYHFRFSSFQGRPNLWLDDLYVDSEARRSGAGQALMSMLALEATKHDCSHIGWTADAKNPSGIPFYKKIGAALLSQNGSRLAYSVLPEALTARITEINQPNQALQRTRFAVTSDACASAAPANRVSDL